MSYYDDRRYGKSRGRNHIYAAEYYDEHPDSRYSTRRDSDSRQSRRPRHEFRRRASSIGGDPSYHLDSRRNSSRPYKDYERPSRSSRDQNRRQSMAEPPRANKYQGRDHNSDQDSDDDSRDQGHSSFLRDKGGELLMHAALPLVAAGAAEALRTRKEPGEWKGDKGKHVLTAAVTNGLVNKDPGKPQKHHIMDTTLRGLHEGAPSREERAELQRRFGGSSTTNNLEKVAAVGAVAFAGKELYDRYGRSRSTVRDSSDDRSRSKKRSQSVSDDRNYRVKSPDYEKIDDRRGARYNDRNGQTNYWQDNPSRGYDSRYWDYSSDGYSDPGMENGYYEDYYGRQRGSRDLDRPRSLNRYSDNYRRGNWSNSDSESDSDLGDTSDEREKEKKMKRDMLLTSGLATVATVHAAHKVYGSLNKRKERMAQLEDGEITAEEARKERIKANTIDAASIGLAALGIKGAYGEWKEANEKRKETQNFKHECLLREAQRELKRNHRYS